MKGSDGAYPDIAGECRQVLQRLSEHWHRFRAVGLFGILHKCCNEFGQHLGLVGLSNKVFDMSQRL